MCNLRRVVNLKFEILLTNKTHKVFDESVVSKILSLIN